MLENLLKVKAAPGVLLLEPITKEDSRITYDVKNNADSRGMIVRGKVILVGPPALTDYGATIPAPCKVGDTVWYLEYSGGYDIAVIEGKKYVWSLYKDLRGIVEE